MSTQVIEKAIAYEAQIPCLYRTALYLLGDCAAAERTVLSTLAKAYSGTELVRLLVADCRQAQKTTRYNAREISDAQETLTRALAELDFTGRTLVVLSAVHGYSPAQVAGIVGLPEFLIAGRLHRAAGKLRGECTKNS